MKNILQRSFLTILAGASLLFASCHNDENGILEQKMAVSDAREWLQANKPALEALKFTESINWNNAIVLDNNGEQAIEVPLALMGNAATNVVQDSAYKPFMRLLLIKNPDGSYKAFSIDYTTDDRSFDNNDTSFNILNIGLRFSGYITIQKNGGSVAYSGEYQNGAFIGLHNYDTGDNHASRLVCTYYVTVETYTTCSNWAWLPDYDVYNPGKLPPGYMPGISGPLYPNGVPAFDPCIAASGTTLIASNAGFLSAKEAVLKAGADGREHSITLGAPSGGVYSQAKMNNGGPNDVPVNETHPGAFAAIHNHPNNTPLSTGDIYAAVALNSKSSAFYTSIILTGGETYAIVVNNLPAAKEFVKNFPPDISPNYPPEFPDAIFDQVLDVRSKLGDSLEARTAAIAWALDQNNAGITLMKQDATGKFNRFKLEKNASGTFIPVPCK
ncbi:hypothetical protein [Flavobacterium anhuiense]|uniref:hypothetical protein n=1 Tax=Flavobacterium anhuiense TaxID=459526 RepID=UPI003D982A99